VPCRGLEWSMINLLVGGFYEDVYKGTFNDQPVVVKILKNQHDGRFQNELSYVQN
ncbi:hypothetical protein THRCLA_01901, partial [Thraustotheca clavata]